MSILHIVVAAGGNTTSTVPLKRIVLHLFNYRLATGKAPVCLITDEELPEVIDERITSSLPPGEYEFDLFVVKKTPVSKFGILELYILRRLAERGRIHLIER